MANETQLTKLLQGVDVWNRWREENPDERIDLAEADLGKATLAGVNFSQARLLRANLYQANLSGADLSRANIRKANFFQPQLTNANLN